MRDRLLFGTIGLLVGIIVMQWTMPSGQASIATAPVGNIVALMGDMVVGTDGNVWYWNNQSGWQNLGALPVGVSEMQFVEHGADWGTAIVDKSGNYWEDDSTTPPGVFVNHGQPPIGPVANEQSTWGKIKLSFPRFCRHPVKHMFASAPRTQQG